MKQHTPNVLRLAVQAAGGVERVGELFGISYQAVSKRIRERSWPAHQIRPLCAAGGGIITPDKVLDFLEEAAAAQHGRAEAEAVGASHGK